MSHRARFTSASDMPSPSDNRSPSRSAEGAGPARAVELGDIGPSRRFVELVRTGRRELERLVVTGHPPDLDSLVGWEMRGANTPSWSRLLGIRKFLKGFYRAESGDVFGYNCPVAQNPLAGPWLPRPSLESPKRFGFYRVSAVDPTARDNAYLHAALLDYSAGHNPSLDPSTGLRDYLVEVPGSAGELFLGKAYYALGPTRLGVSFFVLERLWRGPASPRF